MDALTGTILDEMQTVSLAELCRCCALPAEQVMIMVEHGIIEPLETGNQQTRWRFSEGSVLRIQRAVRLQRDLGINMAGTALALELLDEIRILRHQLAAQAYRRIV